jgi:transposase
MASGTLLAADYLSVGRFISRPDRIEIYAESRQSHPPCPLCGSPAQHVQSRYERRLDDLPWHGVAVRLVLRVRRFFCDDECCPRKIFSEPIPAVAPRYARKTARLATALELIGFALGGRAGARAAVALGVDVDRDTLIRAVRRAPVDHGEVPRIVGVDDFAMRRGHTYRTILVDLEHRRRLDVLPDRSAETLAAWLAARPGIELVSRDRAGSYAEGTRQGAPNAVQVADRWHLLKNVGDALERVLAAERKALDGIARRLTEKRRDEAAALLSEAAVRGEPTPSRAELEKGERRTRRLACYERVVALFGAGLSKRAIARKVGLDLKTVRKFLRADAFPERAQRARRSALDRREEYLQRRWAEGCRNATTLWREIQNRGYRGAVVNVRAFVQPWRDGDGRGRWEKDAPPGLAPAKRVEPPSPRQAKWLLIREADELDAEERQLRDEILAASETAACAAKLTGEFNAMIRKRDAGRLDAWIKAARASGIEAMVSFANGLETDRAAVEASMRYEWSNGQLEGQVNRLKVIKRQMYGRAKFDLLRKRVLCMR